MVKLLKILAGLLMSVAGPAIIAFGILAGAYGGMGGAPNGGGATSTGDADPFFAGGVVLTAVGIAVFIWGLRSDWNV